MATIRPTQLQDHYLNALRKEVGLPGFEAAVPLDFGDTAYIAKIPEFGDDPALMP